MRGRGPSVTQPSSQALYARGAIYGTVKSRCPISYGQAPQTREKTKRLAFELQSGELGRTPATCSNITGRGRPNTTLNGCVHAAPPAQLRGAWFCGGAYAPI